MDRISWDDYFMLQAFVISTRSHDPDTQHGSIIVDKDNIVVSQGFNGWPRGFNNDQIPVTRPEKYSGMVHSELNAILCSKRCLSGTKLYVTGPPCEKCWLSIIQSNIKKVVYGPIKSNAHNSPHLNDSSNNLIKKLLESSDILVTEWKPDSEILNSDVVQHRIKKIIQNFVKN